VRKQTAKFIEKRDGGVASNWENIYLTLGASDAIKVSFFYSKFN
jgi:alanine transaminase